jgi:hypothetical protein
MGTFRQNVYGPAWKKLVTKVLLGDIGGGIYWISLAHDRATGKLL